MSDPRNPAAGATPKVTFQELWDLADSERARAELTRDSCIRRAEEQQSESDRDMLRGIAAGRHRMMVGFETIMKLVDRIAGDDIILNCLRILADREAQDASDAAWRPDDRQPQYVEDIEQ